MALLFSKAGRGPKKGGPKRKAVETPFPGIALRTDHAVSAASSAGHQFPSIGMGGGASLGPSASGHATVAMSERPNPQSPSDIAEEWNVHLVAVESNRASLCGHRPQMEDMDTCVDYLFAAAAASSSSSSTPCQATHSPSHSSSTDSSDNPTSEEASSSSSSSSASSTTTTTKKNAETMSLSQLAEYHASVADWGRNVSFWAVFDGHGGYKASTICSRRCFQDIVTDECWKQRRIEDAVRNGILRCDEAIISQANSEQWKDGSTGCVALLVDDYLYIGNLGDSEIVLGKRRAPRRPPLLVTHGSHEHLLHPDNTRQQRERPEWVDATLPPDIPGHHAILLTECHSPEVPEERKRIESAGGVVIKNRLFSDLAVSRAFGDAQYKKPWAEANYISSEPYINRVPLDMTDEFMIIASDGLWDVFKYQEAVDWVSDYLERKVSSGRPVALPPQPVEEQGDSEVYSEGVLVTASTAAEHPADAEDNSDSDETAHSTPSEPSETTSSPSSPQSSTLPSPSTTTTATEQATTESSSSSNNNAETSEQPVSPSSSEGTNSGEATPPAESSPPAAPKQGLRSLGALRQMGGLGSMGGAGAGKAGASGAAKKMLDIRNKKQKFKGAITDDMLQAALSKKNHVAARLANEAIRRGSRDNTTVIVVFFQWEEDTTFDSDESDSDTE